MTAASAIFGTLRDDIVSLRRKPGEPLSEKEIAGVYGVSRTPVREAMLRLADDGLIEIFPQSGTFVARIPVAALPEAIIVRKALEETTARLAAERANAAHLAQLATLLERQTVMSASGDREAFHDADEAFHAGVAEAAGHPGIWSLIQQVKVQVDRYRRLTLPQEGRMELVNKQHAMIFAAIERRNGGEAARRMGIHLDRLLADVADFRDLNPGYFMEGGKGGPVLPDRGLQL